MLDIQWGSPYTIREGFATKWRREWCIPPPLLGGFFAFWKAKRFKMLADGFTVTKSEKTGKWYLYETKENVSLFHVFGNESPAYKNYDDKFELPPYNIAEVNGLRPWQVSAAGKLISSIKHWGAAIDGSELGVGKTYTSLGAIRELKSPIIVVCPKPVINQWKKVIENHFHMNNVLKGIINYELLIRGRKDSTVASFILHRHAKRATFEWKLPKDTIIIWDEAHRLKNFKTKASKTCILAHKQGYKQLFLSATIASSPLELRTIGTCTGLFKTSKEYYQWAYAHGVYKGHWGLEFNNDTKTLQRINKYLFIQRGVRLQRDAIPNFPETEIIVNAYNMAEEDTLKIREIYSEMKRELDALKARGKIIGDSEMAIRTQALQKTELIKVPLMEEMIREGVEAGMSIVVFLNYSASIDALASRLNTTCIYDGRNEKIRGKNVELFQSNEEPWLITNISAAREGLNLGDEYGGHPRESILSPTYSVTKLKQALGRIHRENSKTKSVQKILYIAGTQEEDVVDSMGQKLENLTLINNGIITDDDLKIG
jgi:superfamily II DNA or RNA helicase